MRHISQGGTSGLVVGVDGPCRVYPSSGHIKTVNLAVKRQRKQLLAVADSGERLVVGRADLDWTVKEETAIATVIDPNGLAIVRGSGNELFVG